MLSHCYIYMLYLILLHMLLLSLKKISYLMLSSVVGFYSSSLFCGLLPRAKDTNLTQVCNSRAPHSLYLRLKWC